MPTPVRVAASTLVRDLLPANRRDPPRTGRVLGVFPSAAYLELGGDVVALEASDALGLPCAVTLAVAARTRPFSSVRAGDAVQACHETVQVGPLTLAVVRWWRPRRVRAAAPGATYDAARLALVSDLAPPLPTVLSGPLDRLAAALLTGADPGGPVHDLLGLGEGLTPAGDDALAGLLVTLASAPGRTGAARGLAAAVLARAPTRTTSLSASLLRHAVAGRGTPALLDVVDGLRRPDPSGDTSATRLVAAVVRLLAVGHTSGTALTHGVLAAARSDATAALRSEVA